MAAVKPQRVAVIGAGYAGLAAAMTLVRQGVPVCIFEAGRVAGGRARRVERAALPVDNGQHLVIGAYQRLLALMQEAGVDLDAAFVRTPLHLSVAPDFAMRCPRWPAPLHLAGALLAAKGLSAKEKLALTIAVLKAQLKGWRLASDCTVTEWLARQRQPQRLIDAFWQPLTLAALNTPLNEASAQVLLNVLRDSLGGARAASDMLLPRVDFTALFAEPAIRHIEQHGGQVYLGRRVEKLSHSLTGWQCDDDEEYFAQVIVATAPHQAGKLLQSQPQLNELACRLQNWNYQPIVTVYLQYAASAGLALPMMGLADGYAQWVFDRGQTHADSAGLIAVVISARGLHSDLLRDELVQVVSLELHQRLGLPSRAIQTMVIEEKRATFACKPGLQRPDNATPVRDLWLAGDYTAGLAGRGDYPATLEGAVRSGEQAAKLVLNAMGISL